VHEHKPIAVSDDWTATVWALDTGEQTAIWHGDDAMLAAAWSPGKLIFAAGDYRGGVCILRLHAPT